MASLSNKYLAQITGVTVPGSKFPSYSTLLGNLLSRILLFAVGFSGLYFFLRFVQAGYNYLTSLGDPGKIQLAQKQMQNAAIGLLVVLSTFFIGQIMEVMLGIDII